jgi:hypothetical protein
LKPLSDPDFLYRDFFLDLVIEDLRKIVEQRLGAQDSPLGAVVGSGPFRETAKAVEGESYEQNLSDQPTGCVETLRTADRGEEPNGSAGVPAGGAVEVRVIRNAQSDTVAFRIQVALLGATIEISGVAVKE